MHKRPSTKMGNHGVHGSDTIANRVPSESSKSRLGVGNSYDRLTPLNFDSFIPWICGEMQCVHEVVVKRQFAVEEKHGTKSVLSGRIMKAKHDVEEESSRHPSVAQTPKSAQSVVNEDALTVTSYYDQRGNLIEVAIVGTRIKISRKVVQALNICLPFHSSWTKLTVTKVKLYSTLVYEIAKMLPHSNLTDICFDDTFLPEANYYVVLDHASSIKYISLKRCQLNDLVCKELASRLSYGQPASKTLLILDLGSNNITDVGATCIGDVLRMNRRLIHINLSDNPITDIGVAALLKHLMEFEVLFEEILDKKRRRMKFIEERKIVYENCLKELLLNQKNENSSLSRSINYMTTPSNPSSRTANRSSTLLKTKSAKSLTRKQASNLPMSAESALLKAGLMTQKIVGNFNDVFDDTNIVMRDGRYYCLGNLVLCSINLSYTNLELPSLRKLVDVLKYQRECCMSSKCTATGLLRVVIEGNYTSNTCVELKNIYMYLSLAVDAKTSKRSSRRF